MMMFALLNYDNLSSILDYLLYIDIYQLNCALLCSNWHLPVLQLLKNYLQTMRIECISIGFEYKFIDGIKTNCIVFYNIQDYIKEENIKKYMQILLWVYTYEIQLNNIEFHEEYSPLNIKNAIYVIDLLFKIPANNIDIQCCTPFIIDRLYLALIDSNPCRAAIQTLILYGLYNSFDYRQTLNITNWPILINLKKIKLNNFYFLSNDDAKNILNGAPNLKSLKLDNDPNVLDNLQLILSDQITDVTLYISNVDNLLTLKKHFPNITSLKLHIYDGEETNLDNLNRIELPDLLEELVIEILGGYNSTTTTDVVQILSLYKLIHLRVLSINININILLEVDIMSLIQLTNLTNLYLYCYAHQLKNNQYLAFLSKKVNVILYQKPSLPILP